MTTQSEEKLTEKIVPVPMTHSMVSAVDDYRFSNRLPSRVAAIRELVEFALKSRNAEGSKK